MYFIEIIINIYENYYLEYPNNHELFVTKIILFIVKSKETFPKQTQFQLNECVFIIDRQTIYIKQINVQEEIPIFCFSHILIEQRQNAVQEVSTIFLTLIHDYNRNCLIHNVF